MTTLPLTLVEVADGLAAKRFSSLELTDQLLDRIDRLNPSLDTFLVVTAERARADARASDARRAVGAALGPLDGVPIALKDIYSTAGIETTCHSRVLKGHVPTQDATAVAKLAAAGTVLLGKLATHEFAFGGPSFDLFAPPARNPWNRDHFTSGSSSGSAAAIVAGLCYGTLGSDTGGSIRGPCALTGLAGIKPTYGLVSRAGVFPLSWTLDHVGPMTATIEDSAIMLEAIAGPDSRDPTAAARAPVPYRCRLDRPMSGLRIGVLRRFHARDVETSAEMASALDTAMDVLRGLGAQVTDVEPPPLAEYHDACVVILMAEAWAYHQRNLRTRWADHGRVLRQRVAIGAMIETPHYLRAQQHRRRLLDQTLALFDQVDLLVCPGATREAPTLAEARPFTSLEAPSFTTPFNLTGLPVASAVCGFGPKGLPLGLQFAAAPFEDATALAVAHAYERAAGWWRRRPEL